MEIKKVKVINLDTPRLVLRQYNINDVDDYMEYRSDKDLFIFLSSKPKNTRDEYQTQLKNIIKNYRARKFVNLHWAIELKEENKVIGSVGIYNVSEYFCSMFWELNIKYQNKGYSYEAVKKLIDYIFSVTNICRIEAYIWHGNVASENLAKKLGFKLEGILRDARIKNNKFLDAFVFGLLKKEYK